MRGHQSRGRPAAMARLGVVAVAVVVTVAVAGAVVAGCGQEPTPGPTPEPPVEPWSWEMRHCVAYQPDAYASPRHRVSVTVAATGTVTEVYEPGWGAVAVEEIRAVVRTCGHYEYGEYGDPEGFREQHTVVETGFAADESLLVEIVRLAPPEPMVTSYAAVVRDGDVVVTVRTSELDPADSDPVLPYQPSGMRSLLPRVQRTGPVHHVLPEDRVRASADVLRTHCSGRTGSLGRAHRPGRRWHRPQQ